MTAVVLVHGLYHCPEHFAVVAERLRTAGTEVVVPELHRGSLPADTAAVQAAVDSLKEPPVVLGHSHGGSVITGVRGAGHLVCLAAFVSDGGESAAGLGGALPQLQEAISREYDGSTLHAETQASASKSPVWPPWASAAHNVDFAAQARQRPESAHARVPASRARTRLRGDAWRSSHDPQDRYPEVITATFRTPRDLRRHKVDTAHSRAATAAEPTSTGS
ncbi:alpha/beta fold hydrolase [Streptomyces sp. SID4985]|uniref:alpha/beta fold hydrolase n=1 Tax=Streptomyces sp. SID4985 TaxID=2690292 RepID=UPI001F42742B|nr:alpha/beta fold hydrolase [Streptomyces sp. SID4985]